MKQTDRGKGSQTREALKAISMGNGGSYRSSPTHLQIDGDHSSDRRDWAGALRTLALDKFVTETVHQDELANLISLLRSAATAARIDGNPLGKPTSIDFLEQIGSVRDGAAAGPDLLQGAVWRHAPHLCKVGLFELLLDRFLDSNWLGDDIDSWKEFELLGIPKSQVQDSFKDYRWLGLLAQLCRVFGGTT